MTNKTAYNAIINNAQKSNTGRMNAVIPVEMIDVDPAYQRVEGRNIYKLNKLKREWNYNMMDALLVVPHPETYNFFVVDGLGRLTVARELGLEEIDCVIMFGPENEEERRKFEAEYFLRQADCTDPIKPVLKHNAKVLNGDPVATAINNVCKNNKVKIVTTRGRRNKKELGSYAAAQDVVKRVGEAGLSWTFDVIKAAGYDNESDGYFGALLEALGKIYDGYVSTVSVKDLGEFIKTMSPTTLKAKAIAKYPERASHGGMIAITLFLQGWITDNYGETAVYDETGKKVIMMKTA